MRWTLETASSPPPPQAAAAARRQPASPDPDGDAADEAAARDYAQRLRAWLQARAGSLSGQGRILLACRIAADGSIVAQRVLSADPGIDAAAVAGWLASVAPLPPPPRPLLARIPVRIGDGVDGGSGGGQALVEPPRQPAAQGAPAAQLARRDASRPAPQQRIVAAPVQAPDV